MALKKLKMNQKKIFNVCLERVVPVCLNPIQIYKKMLCSSFMSLLRICFYFVHPLFRQRELQQQGGPEGSLSTKMRQDVSILQVVFFPQTIYIYRVYMYIDRYLSVYIY